METPSAASRPSAASCHLLLIFPIFGGNKKVCSTLPKCHGLLAGPFPYHNENLSRGPIYIQILYRWPQINDPHSVVVRNFMTKPVFSEPLHNFFRGGVGTEFLPLAAMSFIHCPCYQIVDLGFCHLHIWFNAMPYYTGTPPRILIEGWGGSP